MSLVIPCSACHERKPGSLSNVTWAWYRADQKRVAWRSKLCIACFVGHVLKFLENASGELLMCPVCGTATAEDLDAIFCTVYLPGQGKSAYELATCAVCAVTIRSDCETYSVLLPDRPQGEFGGQVPGPQTDVNDPWAALGLKP